MRFLWGVRRIWLGLALVVATIVVMVLLRQTVPEVRRDWGAFLAFALFGESLMLTLGARGGRLRTLPRQPLDEPLHDNPFEGIETGWLWNAVPTTIAGFIVLLVTLLR